MIESEREHFQIFVSPVLRALVSENDIEYVVEILEDIAERVRREPSNLFKQLSELSVGPLQTHRVGDAEGEADFLAEACSQFENIGEPKPRSR